MSVPGLAWAAIAGAAFGLVGMSFAKLTHSIGYLFKKRIAWSPLRLFVGGMVVAETVFALGTTRYIGLGVPTILAAFGPRHDPQDWLLKLLFTAVTLGAGFKGGEVTPLFFIGATLGNALAYILPLPPSLLAGMGFVAVFAGAANTPIASSLMAIDSSALKQARMRPWLASLAISFPGMRASIQRNGSAEASTTRMLRKKGSRWPW